MMDAYAVVVNFSPLSDCWVDVGGEHFVVEGRIVVSVDSEGAFIGVRRGVRLSFSV